MNTKRVGKIPECIGIIMDGNRRWARERDLPTSAGHRAGYEKIIEVSQWMQEWHVPHVMLYTFSTENWHRSNEEVEALMQLFKEAFAEYARRAQHEHVRVLIAGDRTKFSSAFQQQFAQIEADTAHNNALTVTFCLSYGGQDDIVQAVRACIADRVTDITKEEIAARLWTHPAPHPDMIIRPGGERRLSNFLTWQSVYSELFFSDTYWPDFSKDELRAMLEEYAQRERRNGR